MGMPKSPPKKRRGMKSGRFAYLTAAAAAFSHQTRIVENTVDVREKEWRLGFDNGHTIIFCSNGTCRVVKR